MTSDTLYDILIIGAGPAGCTASIYASRAQLSNIVFGEQFGGQMSISVNVENYPGFKSIPGGELSDKFIEHVQEYGVTVEPSKIVTLEKLDDRFRATAEDGVVYEGKTVIYAAGAHHRHLDVPGEDMFAGKGVHYCVTCDAFIYKDKVTAVVGGGDAATTAALMLADLCPKVYLIHRRDTFRGEVIWAEKVKANPKIELVLNNEVTEIFGETKMTRLGIKQSYQGTNALMADAIFIEVGQIPNTSLATQVGIVLNEHHVIPVQPDQSTVVPGFFAAGEVTSSNRFKQIITAAAEGAIASDSVHTYLTRLT